MPAGSCDRVLGAILNQAIVTCSVGEKTCIKVFFALELKGLKSDFQYASNYYS